MKASRWRRLKARAVGQFWYWLCMFLDHEPKEPREQTTICLRCGREISRLGGAWW